MVIECVGFEAFLRRNDSPGTLFYLDPRYWGSEGDYSKALFQRADFERLAGVLEGGKGRFVLSINDVPEIREVFGGFQLTEVERSYTVGSKAWSRW